MRALGQIESEAVRSARYAPQFCAAATPVKRSIVVAWLEQMSPPTFSSSFLHAVDRWQKGGDRVAKAKRGERLKREVLALNDPVICECTRVVYRRLALPQSDIWKFITAGILPETISAWTVDDDIAKGVKGGIPEEWKAGKRWFGLVLQHEPARTR